MKKMKRTIATALLLTRIIESVKSRYFDYYNILIETSIVQDFESSADKCSTDINSLCPHTEQLDPVVGSGDNCCTIHHKNEDRIYGEFILSDLYEVDCDAFVLFIGHKLCRTDSSHGMTNKHGFCLPESGVAAVLSYETFSIEYETMIFMHELGHFFSIPDHYGGDCPSSINLSQSTGREYSESCIYGEGKSTPQVVSDLTIVRDVFKI